MTFYLPLFIAIILSILSTVSFYMVCNYKFYVSKKIGIQKMKYILAINIITTATVFLGERYWLVAIGYLIVFAVSTFTHHKKMKRINAECDETERKMQELMKQENELMSKRKPVSQ